jgi:hypothetical protein
MPGDLWPVALLPTCLRHVRVTERESGDNFEIPHPDLVDSVAWFVKV